MKKINLYAPICGTGYGIASINILKELDKIVDVSLFPISHPSLENSEDVSIVKKTIDNQDFFDYDAPCLKIWHQFDLASRIGKGKYYAYPFFELTKFTDKEKHNLKFPDELFVSSLWAKNIIHSNGIDSKTHIVPLGVDTNIFNYEKYKENNKLSDKVIFATIGKWEKRKSHDLILELFDRAFDINDNVELWMVTSNPFLNEKQHNEWLSMVDNCKLRQKIRVFPRIANQYELAELISYITCGIYISRSEGWNLDLLETMAMGKPVIATNYSAHTEFCNENNSMLINIDSLEDANDNCWFNGFGQWAKIENNQKEQIIYYMRKIYQNENKPNIEGIKTANHFSWKNTVDQILRCMSI